MSEGHSTRNFGCNFCIPVVVFLAARVGANLDPRGHWLAARRKLGHAAGFAVSGNRRRGSGLVFCGRLQLIRENRFRTGFSNQ